MVDENLQEKINLMSDYLKTACAEQISSMKIRTKNHLIIDFQDLASAHPEISMDLLDEPEETIKLFNVAASKIDDKATNYFTVRFKNLSSTTNKTINNIRYVDCGKLVTVEGTIRQKSDVRPRIISAKFECPVCGVVMNVIQNEKVLKKPSRCGCGRKAGFRMLSKDAIDFFSMIIEEPSELLESGVKLSRLKILAKSSLTCNKIERKLYQGAEIKISGVIKEFNRTDNKGQELTDLDWYLDANYIKIINDDSEDLKLSSKDINDFKLLSEKNVIDIFRKNIFFDIKGYEQETEAVVLQLFGGVDLVGDGADSRGQINIAFFGDPGTSKSTILKIVDKFSPKSMYVAGTGTSGVGLTGAVVRDELLGSWTFEAGAIPLSNKGICCVDEVDKFSPETVKALHEPLAQGTVSLNKAGVNTRLQARTAILAAGNPEKTEFDEFRSVFSQINLPSSIIDRFDLVFIMKITDVTSEKNILISNKVISRKQKDKSDKKNLLGDDFYDLNFLRKYIIYAKKNFQPSVTNEVNEFISLAANKLFNKRLSLLKTGVSSSMIGARTPESILRLSEAVAKAKFHEVITLEDVQFALDKYILSVEQVNPDFRTIDKVNEWGVEEQVIFNSRKLTKKDLPNVILGTVERLCKEEDNNLAPRDKVLSVVLEMGFFKFDVETIFDKLIRTGALFCPKSNFFRCG